MEVVMILIEQCEVGWTVGFCLTKCLSFESLSLSRGMRSYAAVMLLPSAISSYMWLCSNSGAID